MCYMSKKTNKNNGIGYDITFCVNDNCEKNI